jgi:hypothetical protein
MAEAILLHADVGAWSLAALAEEATFDRHYVTVAAVIADRIAAEAHVDIEARRHAFADFIDSLQGIDSEAITHRDFIGVCASLIANLARHPIVAYSAVTRAASDRMAAVVVKYPNEVTALASGAAVYLLRVREATGVDPSVPLTALVVENAAASLRRSPDAAVRFRELLQLTTPWA